MIKQINLITLFLCAGQKGPFSLINPSAPLYYLHIYYLHIYYLLYLLYLLTAWLCWPPPSPRGPHSAPGTPGCQCRVPGTSGEPVLSSSSSSLWSSSSSSLSILSPTYHGAAAVCRCDTQLLEFIAAAEIQSWSGVMITQHTSSASSWAYLCQCWKIQKKRCQDDCHFELQILSSKIRISLQFPIRVKKRCKYFYTARIRH